MTWRAQVVTLYPQLFPGPLDEGLLKRGKEAGLWSFDCIDLREFGEGKHRAVDDTPSGGGPGMVLRADILAKAIDKGYSDVPRILLTPRGRPLTQSRVRELASGAGAMIVCSRFEGYDERIVEGRGLEEISIGDFVLMGGEVAAMAMIEACLRLLPGMLGKDISSKEESFEHGLLEHPHFTRPQNFEGLHIPAILTSGHHENIGLWRLNQAQSDTRKRRPDLWSRYLKATPKGS